MPATNVPWPVPLQRLTPWYPGVFGVPGTDSERGLRMHSSGVVYWVDPNYPGVLDQRDGTDPDSPLATVAAALLKCQPYRGDTIAVMANNAWQYGTPTDGYALPVAENVIVNVPGVRIVGVSQSSSTGVIWTPATDGGTCITVNALDVTIEGFLFTEGAHTGCNAIAAIWNGLTAWGDNLTVRNCVFDDTIDVAISIDFVWYAHIHDNEFWECDDRGVYVVTPGSGAAFLAIHNNIFHDIATRALDLNNTDNSHVWANSIYNGNAQGGLAATDAGIVTTGGGQNQVYDNYFSCVLPAAAPGDWDDLNSGAATDAWAGNHCMNGLAITTPT